ncbi:hypothetical protein K0M31_011518 [Melipona bicolor]|uniref:Uncharacterized protein n=1 Tax=Melipona bicolor TaxID=60889 RepID=A0AA40G9T1_9HYME|nr:hypothetical protein K0M31_011518 [Melipona bicolor]
MDLRAECDTFVTASPLPEELGHLSSATLIGAHLPGKEAKQASERRLKRMARERGKRIGTKRKSKTMASIFPQQQSKQPFSSRNPSGLASLFVIVARRERRAERKRAKKNESEPATANFRVSHFSSARVDDGPGLVSPRASTQMLAEFREEKPTALKLFNMTEDHSGV